MRKLTSIGRAEMEVLRYVAEHQPITVGEVAEHFARSKGHARTTVLSVMERLREKGFLTRRKTGGVFHYAPKVPKAELLRGLVRNFVEATLGGSVSPFVAYLSEEGKVGPEELDELKRLVRDLESHAGKSQHGR